MSIAKNIKRRSFARKNRVRNKLSSVNTSVSHKVIVYKSARFISLQLFDFSTGKILCGLSSKSLVGKDAYSGKNVDVAKQLGGQFAKLSQEKGVSQAILDRSSYSYHGKVKSLAEGLREAGLKV